MQELKEKFITICQEAKLVGANFVIVKDDKIVNQYTYGMQSLAKNKEVEDKTI